MTVLKPANIGGLCPSNSKPSSIMECGSTQSFVEQVLRQNPTINNALTFLISNGLGKYIEISSASNGGYVLDVPFLEKEEIPGCFSSLAGYGQTIESAMIEYIRKISGNALVYRAMSPNQGKRIQCPNFFG